MENLSIPEQVSNSGGKNKKKMNSEWGTDEFLVYVSGTMQKPRMPKYLSHLISTFIETRFIGS